MSDGVQSVEDTINSASVYNPTGTSPSVEPSGKPETQVPNQIPYDRFKEVNEARKDAVERVKTLESREKELTAKYDEASTLLNRIRGLADDERLAPYVFGIDKALRGQPIEEVIESMSTVNTATGQTEVTTESIAAVDATKASPATLDFSTMKKEVAQEVSGITTEALNAVQDKLSDHTADFLLELAQERAARYLDALPAEYTDKDKHIIAKLWTPEVNWDAIEADPQTMMQELHKSLQSVLTEYGEPKGIVDKKVQEVVKTEAVPTPSQQLSSLLEKNWGAWDTEGKKAQVGDTDFSKVLAHALRLEKANKQ